MSSLRGTNFEGDESSMYGVKNQVVVLGTTKRHKGRPISIIVGGGG